MTISELYNAEDVPATALGAVVPDWIEQDITCSQVAAIIEGGCASGAYMPAVTYHEAADTMNEHGDYVLQYLDDRDMLQYVDITRDSWHGIAVAYLSAAVELWASEAADCDMTLPDMYNYAYMDILDACYWYLSDHHHNGQSCPLYAMCSTFCRDTGYSPSVLAEYPATDEAQEIYDFLSNSCADADTVRAWVDHAEEQAREEAEEEAMDEANAWPTNNYDAEQE